MGLLQKTAQALILLTLVGCSGQWHLRKALQKGVDVSKDTVVFELPVPIPEVRVDTVFKAQEGDTVVIEKERLKIKYVKLPGDSVFIDCHCEADTVYREVRVVIETPIVKESYKMIVKRMFGMNELVFWITHILTLLLLIYLIFRRIAG